MGLVAETVVAGSIGGFYRWMAVLGWHKCVRSADAAPNRAFDWLLMILMIPDPNAIRESDGWTPLFNACARGRLACAVALVDAGVRIDAVYVVRRAIGGGRGGYV